MAQNQDKPRRAVLYLRLSKEDRDKLKEGDASASIQNQRLLLTDYALQHHYQIVEIYSDDDESGLFDTRPDFERMLADSRKGTFDTIIAKSQSRFSRNMEHIEKYLHHDFSQRGIRFIGVADGTDTANTGNKKARQVNGLVNEWYCEDLSANIRSAFHAKMKDGQYLGASCPYGYVKDPENHNHLLIDDYAADVVRRIYRLYLAGNGKAKIGRILTEDGILIPTKYKREVLGIRYHNSHERETTGVWSYQTIHTILNNEVYIGNTVQNKSNRISYKDKKQIKQPKERWIRVEHTHAPIIDSDTFQRVQARQQIRTKEVKSRGTSSLFSGILFCADCKHSMVRRYTRRGEQKCIGYCCKTYKTQGRNMCPSHAISQDQLEKIVLHSIQQEARNILTPKDLCRLNEIESVNSTLKTFELQTCQLKKELLQKEGYRKKTYQNYLDEVLSKEEYLSYTREFETEIKRLKEQLNTLRDRMQEQNRRKIASDEWIEQFKHYVGVTELTREIVLEFIERIEVNADYSIRIFYKFKNVCTEDSHFDTAPVWRWQNT